jgi:hypothetical protein
MSDDNVIFDATSRAALEGWRSMSLGQKIYAAVGAWNQNRRTAQAERQMDRLEQKYPELRTPPELAAEFDNRPQRPPQPSRLDRSREYFKARNAEIEREIRDQPRDQQHDRGHEVGPEP